MVLTALLLCSCHSPDPAIPPGPGGEAPKSAWAGPDDPHHKFLLRARSMDGRTWERIPGVLATEASSPQLVQLGDAWWVYFVQGGRSISRISFDAATGSAPEPISIENQADGLLVDPDIVPLTDGHWRMYYIFQEEGQDPGRLSSNEVRSASSTDGVHFVREDGVRFSGPYVDPDVVALPDGTWRASGSAEPRWRMFLTQGAQRIASAVSRDGLSFEPEPGMRLEGGGVSSTLFTGVEWWMFLHTEMRIFRATSPDGRGFTRDREAALAPDPNGEDRYGVESPSVAGQAGEWRMVYASTRTQKARPLQDPPSQP